MGDEVDMSSPEAIFIQNMIHDKCVVVFSKTYCMYSQLAKEVFDELQAKYEVVELDQRDDGETLQDILGKMTGENTVPRVFVKGKCIGGGTETDDLYRSGKLEPMLRECGAI
ncbi:glutaredoxin-2, mitochondrial-like [Glandiceps talaboti]